MISSSGKSVRIAAEIDMWATRWGSLRQITAILHNDNDGLQFDDDPPSHNIFHRAQLGSLVGAWSIYRGGANGQVGSFLALSGLQLLPGCSSSRSYQPETSQLTELRNALPPPLLLLLLLLTQSFGDRCSEISTFCTKRFQEWYLSKHLANQWSPLHQTLAIGCWRSSYSVIKLSDLDLNIRSLSLLWASSPGDWRLLQVYNSKRASLMSLESLPPCKISPFPVDSHDEKVSSVIRFRAVSRIDKCTGAINLTKSTGCL